MQKPKHNKRQHQMCRANMCPIFTRFAFFSFSAFCLFSWKERKSLDTFILRFNFFQLNVRGEYKKWVSCHTQQVRSECERKNFHGKLNENKKVFYHFSIRLYRSGHINHHAAVVVTALPIVPFFHGTSESLISPNTKLQLCSVVLHGEKLRRKSLKFMLWLFDSLACVSLWFPYVRFWTVSFTSWLRE